MQTRSRTSLFDALAEALAATLARRPLLAVLALVASIPLFGDIVWGAAAAFVAFTLAAGIVRRRSTRVGVSAVAVLLACWAGRLRTWESAPVHRMLAGPVLATLTIALLALADRRAARWLVVPVATAAAWFIGETEAGAWVLVKAAVTVPEPDTCLRAFVEIGAVALKALAALLAGICGHAIARGPASDAATRCVVAVRRSPWKASLLIALAALVIGAHRSVEYRADSVRMFLIAALPAAVLLGTLARAAPSSIDVLAPVAAASTLTLLSSISLNSLADRSPFHPYGIVVASVAVPGTFCVAWLFDDERLLASARVWIWWALVVVACALALPNADPALHLAALALVPFVLLALVGGTASAASIVRAAAAFGLACSAALAAQRMGPAPPREWGPVFLDVVPGHRTGSSAWWPLALSLAVALAAIAARRLRSMTVVPRDHPIVEDFGGEERSLRAGDVTSGRSGGPIA